MKLLWLQKEKINICAYRHNMKSFYSENNLHWKGLWKSEMEPGADGASDGVGAQPLKPPLGIHIVHEPRLIT